MGFSLQRFAPLASPAPSLNGSAPHDVVGRGPPERTRNAVRDRLPCSANSVSGWPFAWGTGRDELVLFPDDEGSDVVGPTFQRIWSVLSGPFGLAPCRFWRVGPPTANGRARSVCPVPRLCVAPEGSVVLDSPIRSHEGFGSCSTRHRHPEVLHRHSPEGGWELSRNCRSLVRQSR